MRISSAIPRLFVGWLTLILLMSAGTFLLFTVPAVATPSTPAGNCSDAVNGWYKCWQTYDVWEKNMNSWCSKALSTKREDCKDFLKTNIFYNPVDLAEEYRCKSKSNAEENKDCYAQLYYQGSGEESDWYNALDSFLSDCGVTAFEDVTRECREERWIEFLDDHGFWDDSGDPLGQNPDNPTDEPQKTPFAERIAAYLRWLIAGIGILGVFGVVIAGIQYSAAQGNAQAVAAAKERIINVVIGILIYLTMFALLQWLVPGGVF